MDYKVKKGLYTHNGVESVFNYKTQLSAYDKMRFVSNVGDYIIVDDGYYSIVRDLFFDFMMISIFTDVDLSEIEDASNSIDVVEDFVKNTEIVKIVKSNIDESLLDELNKGVDENLAYRSGVQMNSFSSALTHLIETIENQIKDIDMESMIGLAQRVSNIQGDLTVENIIDAYSKSNLIKNNDSNNDKIVEFNSAKSSADKDNEDVQSDVGENDGV